MVTHNTDFPDYHAMLVEEYGKNYSEENFPLIYEVICVNKKGEIRPFEISVGPYKKKSKVGEGTTFTVKLPIHQNKKDKK